MADRISAEACRRLVTWPLGIVAGFMVFGVAVSRWGLSAWAGLLCGALAALLATRVRDWLEARAAAVFSGDGGAGALAFALDLAVGAAVGLAASALLGASVIGAIGSGAVLAGVWSFLVGQLFCGGAIDHAVDFLLGGAQSADFAREPILADGDALERAGRMDDAIEKYRAVAALRPAEPEAYLRAARLLRDEGRAPEAARLLHEARRRARLTSGYELMIGRTLADLAAGPLGDPAAAVGELALLADRFRGTPAGDAVARDLEAMRGRRDRATT